MDDALEMPQPGEDEDDLSISITFVKRVVSVIVLGAIMSITLVACGGSDTQENEEMSSMTSETPSEESTASMAEETTGAMERTTDESEDLSQLEVGPDEEANMLPASGLEQAEARPLPEDPPEGIEVYPPAGNAIVEGDVDYPTSPATNGDHDQFWMNCGFYDEPVLETKAVHSLDHGVVWITYQPDLPQPDIDTLRETYGTEPYVVVSPYPDQDSPVVVTSWRIQLKPDGVDDPRLGQFVDDFRISEIAPLSGNGCIKGSGDPVVSGPASYYEKS